MQIWIITIELANFQFFLFKFLILCIKLQKSCHMDAVQTAEKVDFKQIRVDDDPKTYDELKKKTNLQTVPQVFVDGKFIGSATDFFAWIDS